MSSPRKGAFLLRLHLPFWKERPCFENKQWLAVNNPNRHITIA